MSKSKMYLVYVKAFKSGEHVFTRAFVKGYEKGDDLIFANYTGLVHMMLFNDRETAYEAVKRFNVNEASKEKAMRTKERP